MVSAEFGGTGGKSIEPGMVVEEPDIEIGAGVSSKGEHFQFRRDLSTDSSQQSAAVSDRTREDDVVDIALLRAEMATPTASGAMRAAPSPPSRRRAQSTPRLLCRASDSIFQGWPGSSTAESPCELGEERAE